MRALVSLLLNLKKCGLFFLVSLCLQLVTVSGSAQFTKLLDMGSNGAYPNGSLYFDGTFLFGVTGDGFGTIYKVKPDGTGYQNLIQFDGGANGNSPNEPLISDGTFLYGTTSDGGTNDMGTLFKIKTDGTAFVNLLNFDNSTGGTNFIDKDIRIFKNSTSVVPSFESTLSTDGIFVWHVPKCLSKSQHSVVITLGRLWQATVGNVISNRSHFFNGTLSNYDRDCLCHSSIILYPFSLASSKVKKVVSLFISFANVSNWALLNGRIGLCNFFLLSIPRLGVSASTLSIPLILERVDLSDLKLAESLR